MRIMFLLPMVVLICTPVFLVIRMASLEYASCRDVGGSKVICFMKAIH